MCCDCFGVPFVVARSIVVLAFAGQVVESLVVVVSRVRQELEVAGSGVQAH